MMFKRGLAAAAAASVAITLAGCTSKNAAYEDLTASYANGSCTASSDEVGQFPTTGGTGIHVETAKGRTWVVGQVWPTCSPSPISHVMDVELWFHSLGSTTWEERPPRSNVCNVIPGEAGATPCAAAYQCVPGLWQVRWSVVGKDNVGNPYVYNTEWGVETVTALHCDHPQPTGGGTTKRA